MIATQQELYDARVPLHWRDYCSHLLIPLNVCRRETMGAPWKCGHERHAYEQCQFKDWLWRQEKLRQDQAAEKQAKTASQ